MNFSADNKRKLPLVTVHTNGNGHNTLYAITEWILVCIVTEKTAYAVAYRIH